MYANQTVLVVIVCLASRPVPQSPTTAHNSQECVKKPLYMRVYIYIYMYYTIHIYIYIYKIHTTHNIYNIYSNIPIPGSQDAGSPGERLLDSSFGGLWGSSLNSGPF